MEKSVTSISEESSTPPSLTEELVEELPAMAAGVLAGVVLFILLAIIVVFALGVLLDRRQQRVMESKQRSIRQRFARRRPQEDVESDVISIACHMEPSATEAFAPVYAAGSSSNT